MKLLLIDIETAPHEAFTWGLYNQNIAPKQIKEPGYTICWAAKWYKEKGVIFDSKFQSGLDEMIRHAWRLLDRSDAVIHYNGKRFDVPTLNKEFLRIGLLPPSPYKQIDLLQVVRRQFRLYSNKLDEVLRFLGMPQKLAHKGMDLWIECMDDDPKAWKTMERYNRRDVTTMERLYKRLLPWIENHPNYALYVDESRPICKNCGDHRLTKQGVKPTTTMIYQQYQCKNCGRWQRERKNCTPDSVKENVLV